jgi:hypothetical protein
MINGKKVDVSPKAIVFADKEGFINPRRFHQGDNPIGLDDESMCQLMSDIKERGIINPIICRCITPEGIPCENVDGYILQLVDGERRLRASLNLELNVVPCLVYENMSDNEAWICAWRSNDTAKSIGENATAALVKHWRQSGYNDDQILKITNRTTQWLRQMDVLGNLDNQSFEAYAKGMLSLRVALKLALIDDIELRHNLLEKTLADAEEDHQELIAKDLKAVDRAKEKVEIFKAEYEVDEVMGKNVDKIEINQAENALENAKQELEKHENNPHQAKAKNLAKASKLVGAEEVSSALTKAKMLKISNAIDNWIENEGRDGNEFIGHLEHLHLAKIIFSACLNGDDNIKKVFVDYYEFIEELDENDDEDDDEDEDDEDKYNDEIDDFEEEIEKEEVYDKLRQYAADEED